MTDTMKAESDAPKHVVGEVASQFAVDESQDQKLWKGNKPMMKFHKFALTLMLGLLFCVPSNVWAEMGGHHEGASQGQHGGQYHEMEKSAQATGMDAVFGNYFAIQSALAADSMDGVSAKAEAIAEAVEGEHGEIKKDGHGHGADMHVIMKGIADTAESLAEQGNIKSAREEFGDLSEKMIKYYESLGDDSSIKAHVFNCGMARKSWLQKDESLRNPYYGAKMLTCGRKIR